jgi:type IV pilus assembly protein PilY1
MRTHLSTTSHRLPRATLVATLVAALLAPAAARANERTFSAGSLIIPASIEYQSDNGVLGTYALVYIALRLNATRTRKITFYWAVQPSKLSQYRCDTATDALPDYSRFNDDDGCDFAVQYDAGQPVSLVNPDGTLQSPAPFNIWDVGYVATRGPERLTTTNAIGASRKVVKYLGGAWIVDAVDRQEFLQMLATEPKLARFHQNGTTAPSTYVNIHSANAAFRASIASVMVDQPKRIAVTGSSSQKAQLVEVLQNAGLCQADTISDCAGTFAAGGFVSGSVLDYYADAADVLEDRVPGCKDRLNRDRPSRLNCIVNNAQYGMFWDAGFAAGGGAPFSAAGVANLQLFLETKGNAALFQYDGPLRIESTAAAFQTSGGINNFTANVNSAEDCNDQELPTGSKFESNGGACLVLEGANQPWAQTGNFVFDGGQGSFKGFELNSGATFREGVSEITKVRNGATVASARYKDDDEEKGLVLYVAGHQFSNGRLWGERLILNTLFAALNNNGLELARSEPVGYKTTTATDSTTRVYQGTYVQLAVPESNDVITYNASAAQRWKFPYTAGHLYEFDPSRLAATTDASTTAGDFANASAIKNWDAAGFGTAPWLGIEPAPANRRIYTYVGGSANLGWTRIPFHFQEVGTDAGGTARACTDIDIDGKCDLSELLALGNSAGVTSAALKTWNDADRSQARRLGLLVSQVRGHCSAHVGKVASGTPILQPDNSQCDRSSQKNVAKLGGIDHSTPAIVGPSRYVTDGTYSTRPVVVYAGARDGMLHAFYVSGDRTWSADEKSFPSDVDGPGEELWAIVPPGQVPRLAYNDAMVDGTINVVDVFGDFPHDRNGDGVIDWRPNTVDVTRDERPNGVRRWRTVLVASTAAAPSLAYSFRGGSELFALDVTNPLHPILLWHVDAPTEATARWDTDRDGVFEDGEVFDPANPATFALKWSDDADVNYDTTSATEIAAMKTSRYDYRNLGLAYSTAVAKLWDGSGYAYTLFVATNAVDYYDDGDAATAFAPNGYRGAEVFAIDVITGQKRWQWEHVYDVNVGPGVDNSIPPRMALGDIDATGSTERIYLGDMEGHLWELYSRDGRNVNFKLGSDGDKHSFPLFGTVAMTGTDSDPDATAATKDLYRVGSTTKLSQQPLTTPIGQGRFTQVPDGKSDYLLGRLALVIGTMGVDWSIAPFEKGHLMVVPIFPDGGTKLTEPILMTAERDPKIYGVLREPAAWDIPLAVGERVYGMPRVVNNNIVFNSAFGSFAGDLSTSFTDPGNLHIVSASTLGVVTDSSETNDAKSFGGVLVIGSDVIVTTDKSIRRLAGAPAVTGGGVNVRTFNRSTPAIMKSWEVAP